MAAGGGGSTTALDASRAGKGSDNPDDVPELEALEDDDGPIDETGVDPKEIELVMAQVNCSRAKAVRVLKENGGDLINASVSIFIRICDPTFDLLFSALVMAASE
jgi:nascent polypeptide-associated complex subunit alpha